MELKEQDKALQSAGADLAEAVDSGAEDVAIFSLWKVPNVDDGAFMRAAIAGSRDDLVELLSEVIVQQPTILAVIKRAIDKAGTKALTNLVKATDGEMAPHECDCPKCTARRERAKNNPNIN